MYETPFLFSQPRHKAIGIMYIPMNQTIRIYQPYKIIPI